MRHDPAYHLRTNKNVERTLFAELLRRFVPHLPIPSEDYTYVGLGGPYLEDFGLVETLMGCRKMVSLETQAHVRSRQEFNAPHCRITTKLQSTTDFSEQYSTSGSPLLVWFDYTKHNWSEQILECCELIRKLPPFSIFKVTFAATPRHLYNPTSLTDDVIAGRLSAIREMFGQLGTFEAKDVTNDSFHLTLHRIFARAVSGTLGEDSSFNCRSLAAYSYSDGTPMLTVTIALGPLAELKSIINSSRLSSWSFSSLSWRSPINISIPDLSLRERLAIERLLPDASATQIQSKLKIRLAPDAKESRVVLGRYIRFAQHVPYFVKMHS